MNTFENFDLLPTVKTALHKLGFNTPTEIQAKTIPLLLKDFRKNVHAQAQTGTGKTLAFGLPLLQSIVTSSRHVQSLVVVPTRELAVQVSESLKSVAINSGVKIAAIYGGVSIVNQISDIKKGVHIVVGTPGRINDHIQRKTISLNSLTTLVLDEADTMLEMGFKEDIDKILKKSPDNRNIWLFSATIMSGIDRLIKSHMKQTVSIKLTRDNYTNTCVKQQYCLVKKARRMDIVARIIETSPNFYGIIFCRTKILSDKVASELAQEGFKAKCLHGDMKQPSRTRVINEFKNRQFSILVATDVAARGIDVSDLTHVINYSMPDDLENFVHRTGRTGRAGKVGEAILLVAPAELHYIKRIKRMFNIELSEMPMPSTDAIIGIKIDKISDFINKRITITGHHDNAIDKAIDQVVSSLSSDDVYNALAAMLKDTFFPKRPMEVQSSKSSHRKRRRRRFN